MRFVTTPIPTGETLKMLRSRASLFRIRSSSRFWSEISSRRTETPFVPSLNTVGAIRQKKNCPLHGTGQLPVPFLPFQSLPEPVEEFGKHVFENDRERREFDIFPEQVFCRCAKEGEERIVGIEYPLAVYRAA